MQQICLTLCAIAQPKNAKQDRFNSRHLTKIDQRVEQVLAVTKTSVFVGPMLKQLVDVAIRGDEPVRPEGDAALVPPGFDDPP